MPCLFSPSETHPQGVYVDFAEAEGVLGPCELQAKSVECRLNV